MLTVSQPCYRYVHYENVALVQTNYLHLWLSLKILSPQAQMVKAGHAHHNAPHYIQLLYLVCGFHPTASCPTSCHSTLLHKAFCPPANDWHEVLSDNKDLNNKVFPVACREKRETSKQPAKGKLHYQGTSHPWQNVVMDHNNAGKHRVNKAAWSIDTVY